jgi:dihydropteroate synthase
MQSKVFSSNKTLNLRGKLIDLTVPKVMGILNLTPDSFYDGGKFEDAKSAEDHVSKMLHDGADFIDVGGYSSRPGAVDISESEELRRVIPVIEGILRKFPETIISIDTFRASVARRALTAGASMINDISGGADAKMFETVADARVPYIAMHMKGTPQTMAQQTDYTNLLKDIIHYFHLRISQLRSLGVTDIIADPGFGFAKTIQQNFELLEHLDAFNILGLPILAGLSRKSMIWKTLEDRQENALNGTTALNIVALLKGASILRVHDVREAVECIRLAAKINTEK